MGDYLISRSEAISAIKRYCEGCDNYNGLRCRACDFDNSIAAICGCKIVDAVEVVRCKDCKYWVIDDYWNGNPDQIRTCRFAGWMCGANGYCLYGERYTDLEESK